MTEELLEKANELSFAMKKLKDRIGDLSYTKEVEVRFMIDDNMHRVFKLEEEAVGVLISYYSGVLARLEQEFNDLK